jgi:hypothetical protein
MLLVLVAIALIALGLVLAKLHILAPPSRPWTGIGSAA